MTTFLDKEHKLSTLTGEVDGEASDRPPTRRPAAGALCRGQQAALLATVPVQVIEPPPQPRLIELQQVPGGNGPLAGGLEPHGG
jgi:hypothetical protein